MATAAAFRHTVKLDQVDPGLAFLNVHLEGPLDAKTAQTVASEVSQRIDKLSGRPFGLLVDLRDVTACDDAGAGVMKEIEMGAASKGLEVVAHLVNQKELVVEARAATLEVGAENMFGTFDDEAAARRFASGLNRPAVPEVKS
jgi:anti-anti-sigma regulatory factor